MLSSLLLCQGQGQGRRGAAYYMVSILFCLLLVARCVLIVSSSSSSEQPQLPVLVYAVQEERPVNSVVGNIRDDSDLRVKHTPQVFASLRFELTYQSTGVSDMFVLDRETGILSTRVKVDRESLCIVPQDGCDVIMLDVKVLPYQYFQIIKIKIVVVDINDNTPAFPSIKLTRTISESAAVGTELPIPAAEDPDSDVRGIQKYELVTTGDSPFTLRVTNQSSQDADPGQLEVMLVLRRMLDREQQSSYKLQIRAWDGGTPPLHGSVWVDIAVGDANDNSPVFDSTHYEALVAEHASAGTEVLRVRATDADEDSYGLVTYRFTPETESLYGELFTIDSSTGSIYVSSDGALNREERQSYKLDVMATDNALDSLPTFAQVIVNVRDVNDNAPQIVVNTLTETGYALVTENAPSGIFVAHITVSDADDGLNGETYCELDNSNFELQQLSSGDYKMTSTVTFDREVKDTYVVALSCHDGGQPRMTSAKNIVVRVTDENDNGPQFSQSVYSIAITEGNAVDAVVMRLNATDRDAGSNGEVNYRLADNDVVYVDTAMGVVRAKMTFDYEAHNRFEVVVTAIDNGESRLSASATLILNIIDANDHAPHFLADAYSFAVSENVIPNSPVGTVSAFDVDSSQRHGAIMYAIDPPVLHFDVDQSTGVIVTRGQIDRELRDVFILHMAAFNPDSADVRSYVNVTVNITDVNDNPPSVVFPSAFNNTVYVSAHASRGYIVTSVVAYDRDAGDNGRLRYVLDTQHSDVTAGLFDVSADRGEVSVAGSLTDRYRLVTRMRIVVRDSGVPPRESRVDLYVIVSDSAFLGDTYMHGAAALAENDDSSSSKDGGGLLTSSSLLIVLAVVFGLATVILVVAIAIVCFIKRRRQRADKRKYEGDGTAMFTQLAPDGAQQSLLLSLGDRGCSDVYGQRYLLQPYATVDGVIVSDGRLSPYSDKQPQLQPHMLVTMARGEEWESASCTDSGQGASDEGDSWSPRIASPHNSDLAAYTTRLTPQPQAPHLCHHSSRRQLPSPTPSQQLVAGTSCSCLMVDRNGRQLIKPCAWHPYGARSPRAGAGSPVGGDGSSIGGDSSVIGEAFRPVGGDCGSSVDGAASSVGGCTCSRRAGSGSRSPIGANSDMVGGASGPVGGDCSLIGSSAPRNGQMTSIASSAGPDAAGWRSNTLQSTASSSSGVSSTMRGAGERRRKGVRFATAGNSAAAALQSAPLASSTIRPASTATADNGVC